MWFFGRLPSFSLAWYSVGYFFFYFGRLKEKFLFWSCCLFWWTTAGSLDVVLFFWGVLELKNAHGIEWEGVCHPIIVSGADM